MNTDIVIDVKNIKKKYNIFNSYKSDSLQEELTRIVSHPFEYLHQKKSTKEFWALSGISFQIKRGEIVGIIGKNGAGKSTLLKIMSRITEPSSGEIKIVGRIASLLEVGTGFNPELTGRENIYLNGSIIGMSRAEIDNKFEKIVSFSGIEEFLDTPVKRYSSGMYVRLAFAVAAHLDTDILIIDEVLAVGDADFQKKSFNKIIEMVNDGRTVLLVSHNMSAISRFCSRAIYLKKGKIIKIGETDEIISTYLKEDFVAADKKGIKIYANEEKWGKDDYKTIYIEWPKGKYPINAECDVVAYNSKRDKIFVIQSQHTSSLVKKSKIIKGFKFSIKNIGFTQDIYIDVGIRNKPDEPYQYVFENAVILTPEKSEYEDYPHKDNIVTPNVIGEFI